MSLVVKFMRLTSGCFTGSVYCLIDIPVSNRSYRLVECIRKIRIILRSKV